MTPSGGGFGGAYFNLSRCADPHLERYRKKEKEKNIDMFFAAKNRNHWDWKITRRADYPYRILNERHRNAGIWPAKIFKHKKECRPEYYASLVGTNSEGLVPALLGTKDGHMHTCDWAQKNTLVAGQTRSGKTCFLQSIVLSILYYGHPDYMRVVVLDTKAAAFKDLADTITVVDTHDAVDGFLAELVVELRRRIARTKVAGAPHDAKAANALAFKHQKPSLAMPYIMVIFDEFADYMQFCKEEARDESYGNIQTLASLGLGLGINLTFATQAPYREYIAGVVKNNFERRISFSLGDFYQEQLILGKQKTGRDESAPSLKCGEFYKREMGERVKYAAPYAGEIAMKNAAKNLRHWGFDFRTNF